MAVVELSTDFWSYPQVFEAAGLSHGGDFEGAGAAVDLAGDARVVVFPIEEGAVGVVAGGVLAKDH